MATTNSSPASPRPANQPRRRPTKVATSVAREILHEVVDRGLAPGAKLPPEIEMAESLGVARASLREGLRILEVHGLITIKPGPGGGPVVAPISSDDLGQTLTFFLHASSTTFREVMGARLVLEPLMARLAAERGDPTVRAALREAIDRGLAPGAKLPPEIEMAESLGVARASLREGLRILEVHGLITIKPGPGGGPVVAPISSDDLGQTLTFFLHASGTTFREVMGARLVLEPLMARLAAERGDPTVRAALREAIDRAGGVADTDDHKYLDIATDFHDIVSGASGNGVLDLLTRSLKDIYVARIRSVVYEPGERARILHAHEAVAEAIINGDGDRAEELMREHMQEFVSRFEERFGGFMNEKIDWF